MFSPSDASFVLNDIPQRAVERSRKANAFPSNQLISLKSHLTLDTYLTYNVQSRKHRPGKQNPLRAKPPAKPPGKSSKGAAMLRHNPATQYLLKAPNPSTA